MGEPANLGVKGGRIVILNAEGLDARETLDAGGRFALPGFINVHVHLDSTLLTPDNLAELIVPHGATMMLTDPMESTNVAGFAGLQALLTGLEALPYHLLGNRGPGGLRPERSAPEGLHQRRPQKPTLALPCRQVFRRGWNAGRSLHAWRLHK